VTRKILLGLVLVLVALTALFAAGPTPAVDTEIRFDPRRLGEDVQGYLERSEASVAGIREGLEKEIVWAFPQSRAKTPLSIVYIHGFSASKGELRPLPDKVAEALGANLFFTRLTGHGRTGEAMADATVNAWLNDFAEALAVGRAIGERVVVVATSTGGAIATWGATQPELMEDVAGLVLISPNYRLRAQGSEILTMPWGGHMPGWSPARNAASSHATISMRNIGPRAIRRQRCSRWRQ
jgi:pimeloyl-ACP methyl ester carboxylesterase